LSLWFDTVVVKQWLWLSFSVLGSIPWWINWLIPAAFQAKLAPFLTAPALRNWAVVLVIGTFIYANVMGMRDVHRQWQEDVKSFTEQVAEKDAEVNRLKGQLAAIENKEQRNKQIRADLARFIAEGFAIQDHCRKGYQDGETHKEFVAWCKNAKKYFETNMEPYYHYLFENSNKHALDVFPPANMSAENSRVWFHVEARKRNLEVFIRDYR